jgi:hypothetical protein
MKARLTFKDWQWGDDEDGVVLDAYHEAWGKVEEAIAGELTKTVQMQLDEDGVDVVLMEGDNGKALIDTCCDWLTVEPDNDAFVCSVPLSILVDEMIEADPMGARNLIDDFRAILAKLEAVPMREATS